MNYEFFSTAKLNENCEWGSFKVEKSLFAVLAKMLMYGYIEEMCNNNFSINLYDTKVDRLKIGLPIILFIGLTFDKFTTLM